MTRLRILFDADDVAETLLEGWVKTLNERYGTATSVEDVTDWDVSKAFPTLTKQQIYGVLQEDEVWANLTPMPGAQEYLKRLYDEGHELYMVTATDYRTCRVKIERILELFPFLDANQMNDEICVKSQWIHGLTFPFSIPLNSCHTGIPHRHLLPYSFSPTPQSWHQREEVWNVSGG